jgi:hypothetical protein
MEKNKKINTCTIEELRERLAKLAHHDKTLNSQYAQHLIARISILEEQEKQK